MVTSKVSSRKSKMPAAGKKFDVAEMRRIFPHAEEDAKAMIEYDRTGILPARLTRTVMRFPIPPTPDEMRALRKKIHVSQSQMANLLNTPKKTYQNWEQGLRSPDGAITLLLNLIRKEPKVAKLLMDL